jgi:hypothetical protein
VGLPSTAAGYTLKLNSLGIDRVDAEEYDSRSCDCKSRKFQRLSLMLQTIWISVAFSFFVFVLDHHRTTTPINVAAQIKKEEDALSKNEM